MTFRKVILAAASLSLLFAAPSFAKDYEITPKNDALYSLDTYKGAAGIQKYEGKPSGFQMAQVDTKTTTTTATPSEPTKVTTVVKGGGLAAQIIEWLQIAFGTTIGAAILWAIAKGLSWFGIELAAAQRAQLQGIVVNGLNAAAEKAKVQLRDSTALDVEVKSQIVADAIDYTQRHAKDTITALGLDPQSGEAVEAIKARIETALNDPATPTPPAITPPEGKPTVAATVSGVPVVGARV